MNVWQVVGYKHSGKTTLMEKWVAAAVREGWRVGTVKHHGHGGEPARPEGVDSVRHERAGAVATAVEGDGLLQLHLRRPLWRLDDVLALYAPLRLDFVLVEGYKQERHPKVVLVRTWEDWASLQHLANIRAVIAWEPLEGLLAHPVFSLADDDEYIPWLMNEVRTRT
ncbi:molybdopterin-guanine dinucleotide biosynthesis protein B [Geobacillus sp. C56-T3]|uniref:molybdopterin-guanine dinucleotide biosynthesis protein B n=1 Tax=Geobacillus sp. (strain C56-T3) TaxID=691437 RepID=UPI0001D58809|nr:molybdopterin-guanine dinucleotide biosynthesis protein B [Geobacillus sp. C56-T3]ADI27707.1 molybdopterin-guanine dinucleotide biosynthesis protein B [Geobacillus sp. C56-T3]